MLAAARGADPGDQRWPIGGRALPAPGRRLLAILAALLIGGVLTIGGSVGATTTDPLIVASLAADGRYIEASASPALTGAADRANADGVAFVWLDRSGAEDVAVTLADEYVEELGLSGSPLHTVFVVIGNGFAASSLNWSQSELDQGLDAAFDGVSSGDMARGLDAFVTALPGGGPADAGTATTQADGSGGSGDDSGGGIGLGSILLVLAVAGGGFFLVRGFLRRRKDQEQAAIDLEEDRAEIEEQLKVNADRVIALGDRVIASGNRELIVLYEEASAAYQEVSQRVDEAESAIEIDELDDRIDHAEWQFEVIGAAHRSRTTRTTTWSPSWRPGPTRPTGSTPAPVSRRW